MDKRQLTTTIDGAYVNISVLGYIDYKNKYTIRHLENLNLAPIIKISDEIYLRVELLPDLLEDPDILPSLIENKIKASVENRTPRISIDEEFKIAEESYRKSQARLLAIRRIANLSEDISLPGSILPEVRDILDEEARRVCSSLCSPLRPSRSLRRGRIANLEHAIQRETMIYSSEYKIAQRRTS